MATLYELQNKINRYYALRENLGYIVNYINDSIDSLRLSVNNCLSAYSVDETSEGRDLLSKDLNNLINRRNTIKNTIVPSINFEISIVFNILFNS